MIYLGSIMFFRWEKYRLVSEYESFSAFYFSTIVAVNRNPRRFQVTECIIGFFRVAQI
jgi:hypothetical protein